MSFSGEDLTVRLGAATVLGDVSFAAEAGQVTAIVGPNGSGKTTLLRALTGELGHGGRVALNGRDVAGMKAWQVAAQRAVLPQATPLAFPFTVYEVVRMGLISGAGAANAALPGRALAAVDLGGYENRFFQELSGGEQQRAHLARVLVQVWEPVGPDGPRWLLLDEPVSSLDIGHQLTVMALMRAYASRGGGVIAVMHDLNLTAMAADRAVILLDGRVLAAGAVAEVLCDPVLRAAYGCDLRMNTVPSDGGLFVLPQSAGRTGPPGPPE
ncbi:MAG: heme ABC transporter ATP-binding protein [Pseudomonadota bacterium]